MREEIVTGVNYLKALACRFHRLDPMVVEAFGERLMEILCRRYTGHWYPEKPMKGQAYRYTHCQTFSQSLCLQEISKNTFREAYPNLV
uniref:Anti-proliferative protein domain-containing protein n=1 Tax=Xenopus tropicalis TaxID=8364 RepID=A0A6I8RS67_XENTR